MAASHPSVAASSNGDGPTGAYAGTVAAVQWMKMPNFASSNQAGRARPRWRLGSGMGRHRGLVEGVVDGHGAVQGEGDHRRDERDPDGGEVHALAEHEAQAGGPDHLRGCGLVEQ